MMPCPRGRVKVNHIKIDDFLWSKANHRGAKAEPEWLSCCSCCTGACLTGFWSRRCTNKYTMAKIMIARAMTMIPGPKLL